jgi:hypothetical protein
MVTVPLGLPAAPLPVTVTVSVLLFPTPMLALAGEDVVDEAEVPVTSTQSSAVVSAAAG